MRGGVFNILFNIHEQMSITINRLGLVHNRNRLPVAKGCIISKQILRTLRGDGLSSSLSLCVNIKLEKIKIRISFLGLMDSVVKAVCIRGPELLQEGIGVMVFTDRCLLCLTELVLGIFISFSLSARAFSNNSTFCSSSFLTVSDVENFLSIPTFQALRPLSSSSVSLALFLIRSSAISWFKHCPIRPFITTIA